MERYCPCSFCAEAMVSLKEKLGDTPIEPVTALVKIALLSVVEQGCLHYAKGHWKTCWDCGQGVSPESVCRVCWMRWMATKGPPEE